MGQTLTAAAQGRELPAEEWGRIAAAGLPLAQAMPHPDAGAVVVVELDGQIVATWAAMSTIHLEGCYIDPAHRRSPGVVKALVRAMFQALQARGIPEVLTITQDDGVAALAEKLGGQPVPGQLWILKVGG